jgi:hypothetical protein
LGCDVDDWAERLLRWVYPRKALLVHDLPEYDPAAQYSAGCKVKDVPLGVFTTLGPYDVPFQAYRVLDENSEEQVTPLLSWQCDRERRQAVVDAKAARAKTTELAPADMEFSQHGPGIRSSTLLLLTHHHRQSGCFTMGGWCVSHSEWWPKLRCTSYSNPQQHVDQSDDS